MKQITTWIEYYKQQPNNQPVEQPAVVSSLFSGSAGYFMSLILH